MTQAKTAIRTSIVVEAPIERAFKVFTEDFGRFKPREHNLLGVEIAETVFEPQVGGHLFDRGVDGSECRWARVLAYEPPHRLLLSWHLDQEFEPDPDPARAGEVEVTFTREGEGTRVVLEHRGFERRADGGAQAAESVAGEGGWSGLLAAYAEAAQASS